MQTRDLPGWLSQRLKSPLPGPPSQAEFAAELNYGRHQMAPLPNTRRAAVLVLLYASQGQWVVPLTVRPETMSTHAGQVSFPGGEIERGETIEEAALREYEEELGPPPLGTTLLGQLTPLLVFASNFLVTPCLGVAPKRPAFQPNASEVAEVLETPVADLAHQANHATHGIRRQGIRFQAPHIRFQERRIWGATSMILGEFLALWQEWQTSDTG